MATAQPVKMEVVTVRANGKVLGSEQSFVVQLFIVLSVAAITFMWLRSSNYVAVDGALRALQVYQEHRLFLHGNNHLLYPVNIYIWNGLIQFIGIRPNDAVGYLRHSEAMNAIAAALFLTSLYGLCYKLTNRKVLALFVILGYGSSRAFLAHATNSSEPMVGLLWSGLSTTLAVYGLSRTKMWASIMGGLMLALAMATYQSMVLVGLPVVFLLWQWPARQGFRRTFKTRLFSVMEFAGAFAVGVPIVYGTAYYLTGTRGVGGMVHRFLHVTLTQEIYIRITPIKIVAILPGLAYAMFPCLPRDCDGFRCLADSQYRLWIPVAGMAAVVAALSLTTMIILVRKTWTVLTELERVVLGCCALGLISTVPPLVYLPTYDKLWLQPLAFLFIGGGTLVNAALGPEAGPIAGIRLARWSCALIAVVALSNVGRAASISAGVTPYLKEAQEVSTIVRPKDLLVGDWDGIFLLYQSLYAQRENTFNVPTDLERNGPGTVSRLNESIARAQASGGWVYLLGILDLSPVDWKALVEARGGPSYDEFQEYRRCAERVAPFPYHGTVVTLKRLDSCASTSQSSKREVGGRESEN